MNDEFKHFCDNPNCPNYHLEMNDEKHYHIEDKNIVGAICGISQTHRYYRKTIKPVVTKHNFLFKSTTQKITEKTIYLCDICHSAVQLYKKEIL